MQPPASQHIALPEPSLNRHPLFELRTAAVQQWLDSLPKANLGETTRQLYIAVRELNHVRCSADTRLQTLENLRPLVHFALNGMQKHYLNKPIPLDERAAKVVELCNVLNLHLATGYCMAANTLTDDAGAAPESLALAVHRGLAEFSRNLLRCYQLYTDPRKHFWQTLHKLFGMALKAQVTQQPVRDPILGHCSIQQCYLRPLMLATANPHQLSQKRLQSTFDQLAEWNKLIHLQASDMSQCLFVFNPSMDTPPIYRELRAAAEGDIGINTRDLCEQLQLQLQRLSDQGGTARDHDSLPWSLLKHLHSAWSQLTTRNAPRVERDDKLYIAPGLYSAHFFIANGIPFQDFGGEQHQSRFVGGNPFMGRARDVWSLSGSKDTFSREDRGERSGRAVETIDFTREGSADTNKSPKTGFRQYETRMVNASTIGYCARWPTEQTAKLKTGEVVALREADSQHWLVGALRWIRQTDARHSEIGIELLADAAEAFSARQSQSGQGRRALLLAANAVTGTPLRILVPRAVFRSGQNLFLESPDNSCQIKLGEELAYTDTFSVFASTPLDGDSKKQDRELSRDVAEFDTLWKHL